MTHFEDEKEAAYSRHGCVRCELEKEQLPGCPCWCAKWSLAAKEEDRSWRDRMIVREHEKRQRYDRLHESDSRQV